MSLCNVNKMSTNSRRHQLRTRRVTRLNATVAEAHSDVHSDVVHHTVEFISVVVFLLVLLALLVRLGKLVPPLLHLALAVPRRRLARLRLGRARLATATALILSCALTT